MNTLTLLALDTSTEACSVALLHQGEITHIDELAQRSHTQRILPMVDQILAESGIRLAQLDALAFGRGPGSFTGVRVGAGIAQGLALGADLPVIPISNLTAMAQAAYEKFGFMQVNCAIDARMSEVYFSQLQGQKVRYDFGEFLQWQEIIQEQVIAPQDLINLITPQSAQINVGTGWAAYSELADFESSSIVLPSAKAMLPLAQLQFLQGNTCTALEIEPVYLRNNVAWQKLPGR